MDSQCVFRTTQFGGAFTTIEGLKLDKFGVEKEFPDLKGNENWKAEAIKRFKEKIKQMDNETQRIEYIKNELTKFGYVPLYLNKQGHRPIKLNGESSI